MISNRLEVYQQSKQLFRHTGGCDPRLAASIFRLPPASSIAPYL